MASRHRQCEVLAVLVLILNSLAGAEQLHGSISEAQIINSTWSMYTWKVLGWQYDSPFWMKGSEETGKIGQTGQVDRDRNVRAVCLGEEGDFYVFFTLRSFVDPIFPNLFIQNVKGAPLDSDGKPFSEAAIEDESYIRYGGLSLVFYEDQGGGTFKIKSKVISITHFDSKNPKSYGRFPGMKYFYETIDSVKYERPHEKISARRHLEIRKDTKIVVKYVGDHDVTLMYIPKSLFKDGEIYTLGISNPTLSVKLMLEHNRELFGFRFVLIGQETIDLMKNYMPDEDEASFRGFQKLFAVAGLALSPETLNMLKIVDSTLDKVIPDKIANASNRFEVGKVAFEEIDIFISSILRDKEVLLKIKNYLIPIITNTYLKSPT